MGLHSPENSAGTDHHGPDHEKSRLIRVAQVVEVLFHFFREHLHLLAFNLFRLDFIFFLVPK